MLRKLVGMTSIMMLAGVLCGVSYANPIPTQITFGPSTTGSISSSTSSVSFSGNVSGWAYQAANAGGFTLANASIGVVGGSNGVYTLAANSEAFTVNIGIDWLTGNLSLDTVTSPTSQTPLFIGTITITGSSSGFQNTGYPVGSINDVDFVVYRGHISAGQIVPDPVPEPGTIAMVGSGLLAMAGVIRRRTL